MPWPRRGAERALASDATRRCGGILVAELHNPVCCSTPLPCSPHSAARLFKFSLRICLGCARHGPCFVGPKGLVQGVPPFWTQKGQEVPKCSKTQSRLQKCSEEQAEGIFETLEHNIFSETCLFASSGCSTFRNGKNETAISRKYRIFRVCPVT